MTRYRKGSIGTLACLSFLVAAVVLCGVPLPAAAGQPIVLSIIDNGGDYASTGVIIENYKKANPDKVKEIKLQRGPAPRHPPRSRRSRMPAGRTSTWSSPARTPAPSSPPTSNSSSCSPSTTRCSPRMN